MRLLVDECESSLKNGKERSEQPTGLRPYERSLLCDRVLRLLGSLRFYLCASRGSFTNFSSSASSSSSLCFMRYPDQSNTIALNECRWCRGPIAPATSLHRRLYRAQVHTLTVVGSAIPRSGSSTQFEGIVRSEHGKCSQ